MKSVIGTSVAEAGKFLTDGLTVGMPTETVYGLAANALNAPAVAQIFEIKKRPTFDPLIVHIGSIEQLSQIVESIPIKAQKLIDRFWPGPLTLILKRKSVVPDLVTSGLETVGVRMPDHEVALQLLRSLPFPLAAPSANPFGYISPTNAQHVMDQLGESVPYILDGGECAVGVESTIVSFENEVPCVLRLGGLTIELIESVIGPVEVNTISSSNPHAPGMLLSHYSPRKPMIEGDVSAYFSSANKGTIQFQGKERSPRNRVLSENGNLNEAAQNLFKIMRELDRESIDEIIFEYVPNEGLGQAINDRLKRASNK